MRISVFALGFAIAAPIASFPCAANAGAVEEVQQLASTLWRKNAPYCSDKLGRKFPAKLQANGECDDRDSVIFNGLLCSSGEEEGCAAVLNSQDSATALPGKGAWWRSPRIALADQKCSAADGKCDSFSHDQGLGVMLTVVTKRSDPAYRNRLSDWVRWIDANRPCVIGGEPLCVRGWPRVCRDDTEPPNWPLKGCSLRPGDLAMMQTVLGRLGLDLIPDPWPIKDTFGKFREWAIPFILSGASLNDLGYPSHLAATGVLIMKSFAPASDTTPLLDLASRTLHERQPKNPMFALLAGSPREEVAKLVLEVCPKTEADIPAERTEWIWERKDGSDAPKRTMVWDCIFMANMLAKPS